MYPSNPSLRHPPVSPSVTCAHTASYTAHTPTHSPPCIATEPYHLRAPTPPDPTSHCAHSAPAYPTQYWGHSTGTAFWAGWLGGKTHSHAFSLLGYTDYGSRNPTMLRPLSTTSPTPPQTRRRLWCVVHGDAVRKMRFGRHQEPSWQLQSPIRACHFVGSDDDNAPAARAGCSAR